MLNATTAHWPPETKVLVVDDEPSVRNLVSRAMARQGYVCRTAGDAEEALAAVSQDIPGLAIIDLRMPGQDGIWLLQQLKERWSDLAVIVLTGLDDARTAVDCLKKGAEDYLTKPLNLDELHLSTDRAIRKIQLLKENREFRQNLEKKVEQRTTKLHQALRVIEETYQATIGSLVSIPHPDDDGGGLSVPSSNALSTVSRRSQTAERHEIAELGTLKLAGEIIAKGSSVREVAEAMADSVIAMEGVRAARWWCHRPTEHGWEVVVERGVSPQPMGGSTELAEDFRDTDVKEVGECRVVSVPLRVRGRTEGIWQLCCDSGLAEAVSLTERLGLFLAASLVRDRDAETARKISRELDLFYEMAGASRFTLDLHHAGQYAIDSLHKIIDYDTAGLLLIDRRPILTIHTRASKNSEQIDWVRNHIVTTMRLTCGVDLGEELDVGVKNVAEGKETESAKGKPRSFVNVPLTGADGVAGLIHVSSSRENAFTDEDILFINRLANFLANSVEGVRTLLATVKGRVEMMVEHMSDGVLMLDQFGDVVAVNAAARSILRVEAPNGRAVALPRLPELLDFEPLALMEEERRSIRKVFVVDGVPYHALLSPIEGDDGELVGAVLAFRNFMQETKVDEMKSEFIKIVSHEIRTPLTATKNAIALLGRNRLGELSSDQSRFLNMAKRNIERLITMVNDLLDVSRIEAGKFTLSLQEIDLCAAIESTLTGLHAQADDKGVTLKKAIDPKLPTIYGDETSVHRILTNLVGNALKFTDAGGRIQVDASSTTDSGDRTAVRVCVSDTGVGIATDHLETIFEKFYRVEDGRGAPVVGSGLGLAITKELVEALHGRIWVESELGTGSRFVFEIPVLEKEELYFCSLAEEVDRAQRALFSVALVVVRLAKLPDGMDDAGLRTLLKDMGAVARKTIRRPVDRVLLNVEEKELAVILPETPRQGGLAFANRLLESLRGGIQESDALDLQVGSAVFPGEATTSAELYRLAVKRGGSRGDV